MPNIKEIVNIKTIEQLLQTYDFGGIAENKANLLTLSGIVKSSTAVIDNFIAQTLGSSVTWYYAGVPTSANLPESGWTTDTLRNQHVGDLYFDKDTGYVYSYDLTGGVYSWIKVEDADIATALSLANAAQDTADNKRRVFMNTPYLPYDAGDIWADRDTKILYISTQSRTIEEAFNADDWILATKYTDDTVAEEAKADIVIINNDLDLNNPSGKLSIINQSLDNITTSFKEKGMSNLIPNSVLILGSSPNEFFTKTGTWAAQQSAAISNNTISNYMANCLSAGKIEWVIRTIPNTAYTLAFLYNNTSGETSTVKLFNGIESTLVNATLDKSFEKFAVGFIATGTTITISIETNGTHFGYSDLMLNYGVLDINDLVPNSLVWQPAAGEILGTTIKQSQDGIEIFMLKDDTGVYTLKHIIDASGDRIVDGNDNIIASYDVEGILANKLTLLDSTGSGTTQIDIGNFTFLAIDSENLIEY